jgi:hypothetical protein
LILLLMTGSISSVSAASPLEARGASCFFGENLGVYILSGDRPIRLTGDGPGLPAELTRVGSGPGGLNLIPGAGIWQNLRVEEVNSDETLVLDALLCGPYSVTVNSALQGQDGNSSFSLSAEIVETASGVRKSGLSPLAAGNGQGTFVLNLLPSGTYTLWIKHDQYLAERVSLQVNEADQAVELGTLRAGDVNNDNRVTLQDFSLLVASFNRTDAQNGFDSRADFNGDNAVTLQDFSFLASNFNQTGASLP